MSKELGALERFLNDYLTLCEKLHTNRQEKMLLDKNSPYNVLKTYLQFIDNAEPSEALECLEEIKSYFPFVDLGKGKEYVCEKEFNTIQQALIKTEKEHNSVNLLMKELKCKDFAELRKYARCGYEELNKK